jgi:enoyl reductase
LLALDLNLPSTCNLVGHQPREGVISAVVVFDEYGPPSVLHVIDVPVPTPEEGQILVRVKAAGAQPVDNLFRQGVLHALAPASFPQRLGNEFAGVVEVAGSGWSVGDEVLGWAERACYAEHVVVSAADVVAKPDGLPWEQAGALSASAQTAASALEDLKVGNGDVLLVHAAAGGVGSMAVQLARRRGATVIGTASPANHDYLRSLGAVPVPYGEGLLEAVRRAAPDGVTAALDAIGTREALEVSLVLTDRIGTLVSSPAASERGVPRLRPLRSAGQLDLLVRMSAAGGLTVAISGSYPLAEAAAAHRRLEGGHVRGKLVLTP